jgi:hypothetical protein
MECSKARGLLGRILCAARQCVANTRLVDEIAERESRRAAHVLIGVVRE